MHTSYACRMTYLRMDLHVTASKADIVRAMWSRWSEYAKQPENRDKRRKFYDCLMLEHKAAQDLFYRVNTGNLSC